MLHSGQETLKAIAPPSEAASVRCRMTKVVAVFQGAILRTSSNGIRTRRKRMCGMAVYAAHPCRLIKKDIPPGEVSDLAWDCVWSMCNMQPLLEQETADCIDKNIKSPQFSLFKHHQSALLISLSISEDGSILCQAGRVWQYMIPCIFISTGRVSASGDIMVLGVKLSPLPETLGDQRNNSLTLRPIRLKFGMHVRPGKILDWFESGNCSMTATLYVAGFVRPETLVVSAITL